MIVILYRSNKYDSVAYPLYLLPFLPESSLAVYGVVQGCGCIRLIPILTLYILIVVRTYKHIPPNFQPHCRLNKYIRVLIVYIFIFSTCIFAVIFTLTAASFLVSTGVFSGIYLYNRLFTPFSIGCISIPSGINYHLYLIGKAFDPISPFPLFSW